MDEFRVTHTIGHPFLDHIARHWFDFVVSVFVLVASIITIVLFIERVR